MFELVHVACAWVWSWVSAMEMDSDAFFFQLSTRKKRTIATHLERSGRHLWMNLKMEMALWFPASLGIVTNLEVSPSKKTCAFGEGYEDCRLQIGASNCGSSYQFIVIVQSPIEQYSPLSTCCISSGTMVSGIPSLEHVTASPQHHSWIIPPPSSFTGCHQGACSGNSSRSLHQAMSLRPWYPPWRAPKTRQLRGEKRRAAGFDAWAVPWCWWCDERIECRHNGFKDCHAKGFFWVHRVFMDKIHRGLEGGIYVEVLRSTPKAPCI